MKQDDDVDFDVVKFRGDFFYAKKDFAKAEEKYKEIIGKYESDGGKGGGAALKRDVFEALARTCQKLGKLHKAEKWALKFVSKYISFLVHIIKKNIFFLYFLFLAFNIKSIKS